MEVSGQLYATAVLLQEKEPPVSTVSTGWASATVKTKYLLNSDQLSVQPPYALEF
jgi:hypothetical protein